MVELGNLAGTSGAEWIGRPHHEELQRKVHPLLPADDPFYQPPDGFQHAEPGTVLRSRDVEVAFLGVIPQPVTAIQLLYRTTDMHSVPEAAVTTVIVPAERAPGRTTPLLSYQCAIDAMSSRCFPSYALRRRAKALGSIAQLELLIVAAAVAEGWAVSVPDHEGLRGMWGAPYEPGYRVLDGIRAARNSEHVGISPSAPIGLWGYSGGGLASAWAAEMCGEYAPELDIVGAVLGSPVGDLGHTFRRLNGGFLAGLPAMVVAALAQIYPELDRVIKEHANDEGRALLDRLANDDHGGRRSADGGQKHGRLSRRTAGGHPVQPGGHPCLRKHQAGRRSAGAAGADRAGRARLPDRRSRHRRARPRLFGRRRQRQLPPRRVQRTHAVTSAVRADDAALAH